MDTSSIINDLLNGNAVIPPDGATALFMFSYMGKVAGVTGRLSRGDDPNERSFVGGNVDPTQLPSVAALAINAVIQQQQNPTIILWMPERGFDNLYFPICHQDTQIIQELLQAGADPNYVSLNGFFPLFLAAEKGDLYIVKLLIEHGAKVDMLTPRKTTALMNAADEGHYDVVKYLLECGADKSLRNLNGLNAYDMANNNGHRDVAELLMRY